MSNSYELLVIPERKWLAFFTIEVIEVDCPALVVTALSRTVSVLPAF